MLSASLCPDYAHTSARNPRCGWCSRYSIFIDRQRRLCLKCTTDPSFGERLKTTCEADEHPNAGYCERYVRAVTPEVCVRCKAEPEYQAFLAGQRDARRTEAMRLRRQGCRRRTFLREEERPCCGGKTRAVPVYHCDTRKAEVVTGQCQNCDAWEAEAPDPET